MLRRVADGTRENNDAVAVAKIPTSHDVLACSGKHSGIVDMMVQLDGYLTDVLPCLSAQKVRSSVKVCRIAGRPRFPLPESHQVKGVLSRRLLVDRFRRLQRSAWGTLEVLTNDRSRKG